MWSFNFSLLICFNIGLVSCSVKTNQTNLLACQDLKKVFSNSEIEDLQKILDFFDEAICHTAQKQDVGQCYNEYFKRLENWDFDNGDLPLDIPFYRQLDLYQNISDSTFKDIWDMGVTLKSNDVSTDTFRTLDLNIHGKYVKFLRETGNEDKTIAFYSKPIVPAGGISPTRVMHLLKNHEQYDIKDIRVRLMVAIHYLTLNDQIERSEKVSSSEY